MRTVLPKRASHDVVIAAREGLAADVRAALAADGQPSAIASSRNQFLYYVRPDARLLLIVEASSPAELQQASASLRRTAPRAALIVLANPSSESLAIEAVRCGAVDYVSVPFSAPELTSRVRAVVAAHTSAADFPAPDGAPILAGSSEALHRVKEFIKTVAPTDANVLITGETGTGKELVAELLHRSSRRSAAGLVSINCPALPDTLIESELFGHERGAFTGADAATEGRLQAAHGGTVFLDEVADLTLSAQAKLLRTIEASEIARLGRNTAIRLDLRFVSATKQDLEQLGDQGRFRRDLYYRLKVCHVHLPPVRERPEDVPALLDLFLRRFAGPREPPVWSDEALSALVAYAWPGNVREIRNTVESLLPFVAGDRIEIRHLPEHVRRAEQRVVDERSRILAALQGCRWNKREAARTLHWSRMTLYRKLAKHGIRHDTSTSPVIRAR